MSTSIEKQAEIQNRYADGLIKVKTLTKAIESVASGKMNESQACDKYHLDKSMLRRFINQDFSATKLKKPNIKNMDFGYDWQTEFMAKLLDVKAKSTLVPLIDNFDEMYEKATSKAFSKEVKTIFDMRVKDERTLDEISTIFGRTRERIRQIESKCFNILRNPMYVNMFLYGKELKPNKPDAAHLKKNKIIHSADVAKALNEDGNHVIEKHELSCRTYNCLVRYGLLNTLDVGKFTMEELLTMRNMGARSVEELADYLRDNFDIILGHGGDYDTFKAKVTKIANERGGLLLCSAQKSSKRLSI